MGGFPSRPMEEEKEEAEEPKAIIFCWEWSRNKKLLVTSALLVVARSY